MADSEACRERVSRLRALMAQRGLEAVVLRNNADLRWLTGAARTFDDEVAHTAFVTADGLWLHTDSRYFGTFKSRLGEDTAWQIDQEVMDAGPWAARLVAQTGARTVAVEDTADLAFYDDFAAAVPAGTELPRLHQDIAKTLRNVKDAEELACLREAQRITDDAFEALLPQMHAGMTELEVRRLLEDLMFDKGADALSFGTIIAAGPNGANPHAQPSDYVLAEGDLVVMDFGACYHEYHADMTRTVCVGSPGAEQQHVYDVVRHTNEAVAAAIRPGVIGHEMQELAMRLIAEAGYGDYFGHGLGHGVGLEIHEAPNFSRRSQEVIPAGAVITDEPGIYLPGRFGVRVEDCGIIDEQGYHPFSRITHDLISVG